MSATLRAARVSALDEVPGLVHGFEQRVVTLARNEFALAIEPGGPFGPPRPPGGAEGRDETRRRGASGRQPLRRLLPPEQGHRAAGRPHRRHRSRNRPVLLRGGRRAARRLRPRRRAVLPAPPARAAPPRRPRPQRATAPRGGPRRRAHPPRGRLHLLPGRPLPLV